MRLRAEQLQNQLNKGLLPVYLIYGDEQMLVEETADWVRNKIRQDGAEEREVWHVDGRFDWSQLQWQGQTLSLFSSKRLIEIRLPSGSPGREGGEALRRYTEQPPVDTTLLIISGKIDAKSTKSKWFTSIDDIGVTVPIWPIELAQLPQWINQRLNLKGIQSSPAIGELIAERVEGNLFAAAQEVEKLSLIAVSDEINEQVVLNSVGDNARFEAFGLMDSVMLGHSEKIPRMIHRLRAEGVDVLSVFSAVSWTVQRLVDMARQLEDGARLDNVFNSQTPPVWNTKQAMTKLALYRHSWQQWSEFVLLMSHIDQAAKGSRIECPWSLLETLCLRVSGAKLTN